MVSTMAGMGYGTEINGWQICNLCYYKKIRDRWADEPLEQNQIRPKKVSRQQRKETRAVS